MSLDNSNIFKWWYAKGITTYQKLSEEKTAEIIAMTMDRRVIRKMAPLHVDSNQIVVADCGTEGRFYLTPNQWISPHKTEKISKYWLMEQDSKKTDTPSILGIYTSIDSGMAVILPKGVEIFGVPTATDSTLVHNLVDAIVPVGDGEFIAFDESRNACSFIGDRETDEDAIKIYLDRIGR